MIWFRGRQGSNLVRRQFAFVVTCKTWTVHGPGDRAGIRVGDQVVSVDGISLLNLPYDKSLEILQNTDNEVNLIVSQVFNRKVENQQQNAPSNLTMTPSKSLPNLKNDEGYQLPKVRNFYRNLMNEFKKLINFRLWQ
mgnify:CR=1 FL=1